MSGTEVHLTVSRKAETHGRYTIRARCGQEVQFKGHQPPTFSAWESEVTCPACQHQPQDQPGPVPAGQVGAPNGTGCPTLPSPVQEAAAPAQPAIDLARRLFGESLIRVVLSYACFGVVAVDGLITEAASIASWSVGKRVPELQDWVKSKGGSTQILY